MPRKTSPLILMSAHLGPDDHRRSAQIMPYRDTAMEAYEREHRRHDRRCDLPRELRFWIEEDYGIENYILKNLEWELGDPELSRYLHIERVAQAEWLVYIKGEHVKYHLWPVALEKMDDDELLERFWLTREIRGRWKTPMSESSPMGCSVNPCREYQYKREQARAQRIQARIDMENRRTYHERMRKYSESMMMPNPFNREQLTFHPNTFLPNRNGPMFMMPEF